MGIKSKVWPGVALLVLQYNVACLLLVLLLRAVGVRLVRFQVQLID
jgi:hypothetical protein